MGRNVRREKGDVKKKERENNIHPVYSILINVQSFRYIFFGRRILKNLVENDSSSKKELKLNDCDELLFLYDRVIYYHLSNQRNDTQRFGFCCNNGIRSKQIYKEKYESGVRKEGRKNRLATSCSQSHSQRIESWYPSLQPTLFSLPLISGLNKLPSYKYLDFQLPRPVSLPLSLSLSSLFLSRRSKGKPVAGSASFSRCRSSSHTPPSPLPYN